MGFDVDDVGAVCAAHAMEQSGEARILAIVHDTGYDKGIGAVAAINHYYGRDDIELGAWKGEFGRNGDQNQNRYVTDLINSNDAPVKDYSQVPHCVETYRKVLAAQPDNSVHIASIGMTTCLADLMTSVADQFSDLDGPALVGQKVAEIVWMDGMYNFGCAEALTSAWLGSDADCHGSAKKAVMNVPSNVRQIFSGLGGNIISGGRLSSCAGDDNPCRKAYIDWCGYGNGRSSWDPLATVTAVRGASATKLKENCYGTMSIDEEGRENMNWGSGNSCTVSQDASDNELVDLLEDLYCQTRPPTPPAGLCAVGTGDTSGAGPAMTDYGGGDHTMAWDGNVNTFYDYSWANGGWTRAELNSQAVIAQIHYYPRSGFLERYVGGQFVGVASDGSTVTLATISQQPSLGWTSLTVSSSKMLTAVRYNAPDGGYGNIAEIKLYTACAALI
jgi:hypothetical protein